MIEPLLSWGGFHWLYSQPAGHVNPMTAVESMERHLRPVKRGPAPRLFRCSQAR